MPHAAPAPAPMSNVGGGLAAGFWTAVSRRGGGSCGPVVAARVGVWIVRTPAVARAGAAGAGASAAATTGAAGARRDGAAGARGPVVACAAAVFSDFFGAQSAHIQTFSAVVTARPASMSDCGTRFPHFSQYTITMRHLLSHIVTQGALLFINRNGGRCMRERGGAAMRISRTALAFLLCAAATLCFAAQTGTDAELEQRLKNAPTLATEDLCEPVKSIRDGMLLRAPNPDGKTWDLVQIYFPKYGGPNVIAIIDLGTGEVKQMQTERGWNFHLCPSAIAPNGKLFISILNGKLQQKICLYDPATNELKLDAVKMPDGLLGETHPFVLGTDGKLYAIGQHPSKAAGAAQIDPDTLAVTAYGPIGPSHAPDSCWGYSGAADDRFIYVASGKVPWYLVAYDRQTGTSATLVQTETVGGMVGVSQRHDGCTGSASGIVGTDGKRQDYWLHEGKAVPKGADAKAPPPWPGRNPPKALPPEPVVNTSRVVPDLEGFAELWVRKGSPKPGAPKDEPLDEQNWTRFRYQVPLHPHPIYRLLELPDGRLLGTAGAYEGNFIYDPKTNQAKHLGKCHLSHYATAFLDGKVYMSGYPTSPLYVFDPNQPWTAGTVAGNRVIDDKDAAANPRQLLLLGGKELAGTHKMYAAATGANGQVYFGGEWMRDGACGGLAWYDPKTGTASGMWRPFSNYQITHLAAAGDGKVVVISTRRVEDTVLKKPKPDQGALFFLDTATNELRPMFEPLKGVKGTGPILSAGGSRVIGWTTDPADEKKSILYAVDVREPKVLYTKALPYALPVAIGSNQQENWDFRIGPDGWAWTFVNEALVRIDPASGDVQPVGKVAAGRIAFSEGRVYLGGTTALRRIKDFAVPLPAR
jgi:hypothetical protein